jgi:hypothetical protein
MMERNNMGIREVGWTIVPGPKGYPKLPLKPIDWKKWREKHGYRRAKGLTPPTYRPGNIPKDTPPKKDDPSNGAAPEGGK